MKQFKLLFKLALLLIIIGSFNLLSSCKDNEPEPEPLLTGEEMRYTLGAFGNSGVSGTATFAKLDDNSVMITLTLTGTNSGGDHPTHIHMNTAAEGGAIAIDLSNVDGSTGISETIFNSTNDGTSISYEELIAYNGYINVHNSSSDLGTLLAQGDIGQNVLTGMSEDYELFSVSDPNILGTATFSERVNGETLIVIELTGDASDSDHPAHIHMNYTATTGPIDLDLTNVDGDTGMSKTNASSLNDDTAVIYDELINFNGYINVHNSATDLGPLVVQGNIGSNG
ncbi:MAG: CHRD domain-containing protein [Bacteroidetes bacterium]|nr:CHRD domain-containing protein [Bacteroidota bacterium]